MNLVTARAGLFLLCSVLFHRSKIGVSNWNNLKTDLAGEGADELLVLLWIIYIALNQANNEGL